MDLQRKYRLTHKFKARRFSAPHPVVIFFLDNILVEFSARPTTTKLPVYGNSMKGIRMRSSVFALLLTAPLLCLTQPSIAAQTAPGVHTEKLLETEKSWDGTVYNAYPEGTPQLSMLRITIAPNTALAWHTHPMPNAAYVLSGVLTVEKKSTGEKRTLKAGDVLPEMVNSVHRGYTGREGVTLLVFYAGKKGLPLAVPVK